MTSAPRAPSSMLEHAPAITWLTSSPRMPLNGRGAPPELVDSTIAISLVRRPPPLPLSRERAGVRRAKSAKFAEDPHPALRATFSRKLEKGLSSLPQIETPSAVLVSGARRLPTYRYQSQHGDHIGDHLKQLRREPSDLRQRHRERGRGAEQERYEPCQIGIAEGEKDRGQRDQPALVRHFLGEQRDVGKRKESPAQPAEQAREQHGLKLDAVHV